MSKSDLVADALPPRQPMEAAPVGVRPAPRTVDLNRLLVFLNAAIAGGTVLGYLRVGGNPYIDGDTILLALLLTLQTHVALLLERRRRDPFVIVLAYYLVLFFSLRVLTLVLVPFSPVFDRLPYSSADSNFGLLFILLANTFLYAGLYVVRGAGRLRIELGDWRAARPQRALLLVAVAITFSYFQSGPISLNDFPRGLRILGLLLAQDVVMFLALTYVLVSWKTLRGAYTGALIGLVVLEMLLHSLTGSRSAFVYGFENVLFVSLAIRGSVIIPRKLAIFALALLPAVMVFLVWSFTISTGIRALKPTGEQFSVEEAVLSARLVGERFTRDYALETGVPVMLSRVGFFDYSVELIAHSREYSEVVNLRAYGRSLVDNLLTPGFDLFDQPKISNSLNFVYSGSGKPLKSRVNAESYQSDQLGTYGELYLLFGYASLPLFFFGAFLIKRFYLSLRQTDPFMLAVKRSVMLLMTATILNSFGLDWAMIRLVPLLAAIYIYQHFFVVHHVPRIGPAGETSLARGVPTPPSLAGRTGTVEGKMGSRG
ncbi:MAG: hypothetical protein ACYC6F_08315 [Longimicrobiales bacterium]